MLTFTIITPSFNQGSFLEETILSVMNQTYRHVEHIVIDGGSTDKSIEIIKKYEKHLAWWVSEKDAGQSDAINKGLKVATGNIITWLNSDDFLEPDALEKVADIFNNTPGVGVVHGNTMLFGEQIRAGINGPDKKLQPHEYLPYMRFPQPSSFFKREVFTACGINTNLHYSMDFELVVKAVLLGFKFWQSDIVFSHYRIHENSKSNHDMKFLKEWEIIVCNIFNSLDNGRFFLKQLLQLNIGWQTALQTYPTKVFFNEKELEAVMLEHLYLHYHYHYRELDRAVCKKISTWLKKKYPVFYNNRNFSKYNLRLRLLPSFVFKFARRLKPKS